MQKTCEKLLRGDFESSSDTTDEFKDFARVFKREFKELLADNLCCPTLFNRGHFYLSGFFRDQYDNCRYWSISDVRSPSTTMLVRSAKDEKDFTGGSNTFFDMGLPEELGTILAGITNWEMR